MAYEAGKCCKMYCSVCCRMLRDDVCRKSPAREAQQGLLEVSGVPVALSASHRASLRAFLGGFAQGAMRRALCLRGAAVLRASFPASSCIFMDTGGILA